jgi:hypothetical protein
MAKTSSSSSSSNTLFFAGAAAGAADAGLAAGLAESRAGNDESSSSEKIELTLVVAAGLVADAPLVEGLAEAGGLVAPGRDGGRLFCFGRVCVTLARGLSEAATGSDVVVPRGKGAAAARIDTAAADEVEEAGDSSSSSQSSPSSVDDLGALEPGIIMAGLNLSDF